MFRIEMLPANHGDCIWVEYGDAANPRRILIDTGPVAAWESLRSRLEKVDKDHRQIELLVITHIDSDHIEGAVKLLNIKELDFNIDDVWFNGWKHLQSEPLDKLGAVQGEYISGLINEHNLPWNIAFGGKSVVIPNYSSLPIIKLGGGMTITLLSPDFSTLKRLAKDWNKAVIAAGLAPGDREAALRELDGDKRFRLADTLGETTLNIELLARKPFTSDASSSNGSSIAFLAEYGSKSALFLGDGHSSLLVKAIKSILTERQMDRLYVDAVKLPHHASKNNVSKELMDVLASPRFLVSTNGAQFGHPDPEAISRVITYGGRTPNICFNYLSETTSIWKDIAKLGRRGFSTSFPVSEHTGMVVEL